MRRQTQTLEEINVLRKASRDFGLDPVHFRHNAKYRGLFEYLLEYKLIVLFQPVFGPPRYFITDLGRTRLATLLLEPLA